jgi:signal transduction histidine kinase
MKAPDLRKSLKQLEKRLFMIYAGSLLVLVGFSLFSNQVLKEQAASQATSFIRRMVKLGDFKETIITLSQAKLDYFDGVVYFDSQGTKVFSLPVDLDPKFIDQDGATNVLKFGYVNTQLYFDANAKSPLGTLVFVYGRYEYVKYAVGLWLLLVLSTLPLIAGARRSVTRRFEKDVQIRSDLARADLAKKVRHDIRSPLISLQGFLSSTGSLNVSERLVLDRIVTRIFGIIADLEDAPASADDGGSIFPMEDVVREVVREKQLHIKKAIQINMRFEPSSFLAYSSVGRLQLSRIISNILDNSIEALNGQGHIEIFLRVALGSVILKVTDNGRGIPADILPRIFDKDFSFGKPKGSGIGLSSAKEVVEKCGGRISAESFNGKGASLEIELPVSNSPAWWVDKIETSNISRVVVVDDQETSHDAWRMKLHRLIETEYLCSDVQLEKWLVTKGADRTLFLVDFDLGLDSRNGIDLVRKFSLTDQAILVTGNFDDLEIQRQCASLKLRLLPKPLIASIAIV